MERSGIKAWGSLRREAYGARSSGFHKLRGTKGYSYWLDAQENKQGFEDVIAKKLGVRKGSEVEERKSHKESR